MSYGIEDDAEDVLPDSGWACTRCGAPAPIGEGLCAECQDELAGVDYDPELDGAGLEPGE